MNNDEKNQNLGEEKVEQIMVPTIEEEPKPKGKLGKIILVILLLIVAIAIGLYFGLKRLSANPVSIYRNAINDTYTLVDDYLKESFDQVYDINVNEDPIRIDTSFTLNTNEEDYAMLSDFKYDLSLGLNIPNEQMNIALGLSDDEGSVMNAILAFVNDRLYLESDELYDVPLDFGASELDFSTVNFDEVSVFNYDTLHIILETSKDILIDSLDESKFTVTDTTADVNGKQIEGKMITYLLDEENMRRTMEFITEEMDNNEEFITALSNLTGLTSEEIRDGLQEEIDYSNYVDIEINIYTDNRNDIVAGNLVEGEVELINFTRQDEIFTLFVGDEYTNMTMTTEGNVLTISYVEYDKEVFTLSLTSEEDREILEYRTNSYGDEIIASLEFRNINTGTNEFSADILFDYSMTSYGVQTTLSLDGNIRVSNEELDSIDTANSVEFNALTEEESLVFYENLLSLMERMGLTDLTGIL